MSDFKPRIPSPREARSITWCHIFDGKVHAGSYLYGGLVTLVEAESGDGYLCDHDSRVQLTELRPWNTRAIVARELGIEVCQHCVDDEQETLDIIEANS